MKAPISVLENIADLQTVWLERLPAHRKQNPSQIFYTDSVRYEDYMHQRSTPRPNEIFIPDFTLTKLPILLIFCSITYFWLTFYGTLWLLYHDVNIQVMHTLSQQFISAGVQELLCLVE